MLVAVISTMTIRLVGPLTLLWDSEHYALFSTDFSDQTKHPFYFYFIFILIGLLCGVLGGCFNYAVRRPYPPNPNAQIRCTPLHSRPHVFEASHLTRCFALRLPSSSTRRCESFTI